VVLAAGVINTTSQLVFEARLRIIYDGVHDLLIKYAPDVLILEDLYAEYKFPRTALLMAHARGVVSLAAEQCDVPVMALAPAEVKRAVAFNGAASKGQVQHAMGRILNLAAPPHPSHVADALALAWTGLSRARTATLGREPEQTPARSPERTDARGPERAGEARGPASPDNARESK